MPGSPLKVEVCTDLRLVDTVYATISRTWYRVILSMQANGMDLEIADAIAAVRALKKTYFTRFPRPLVARPAFWSEKLVYLKRERESSIYIHILSLTIAGTCNNFDNFTLIHICIYIRTNCTKIILFNGRYYIYRWLVEF